MTITIILSQGVDCKIKTIVKLVNRLQLFFVAEYTQVRVVLPSKPLNDSLLQYQEIVTKLKAKKLLQANFPEQQFILLTRRRLATDGHTLTGKEVVVISDSDRNWKSLEQRSLWFAAQIVRCGLANFISYTCPNDGCICSLSETFFSLCAECERRLKALDYRDAVLHLKGIIQWLNERLPHPQPDLSRPSAPQVPARLRLAEYYAGRDQGSKPFRGKAVLMVLHFLSDLVPFVNALNKMGAAYSDMILVAKPYPYPKRDYIGHHLQHLGVNVYRASKQCPVVNRACDILRALSSSAEFKQKKIVVIEDGGYFTPILHRREFRDLRCIGSVEQTTKGIREDEDISRLRFPVLNVAKCNFKSRYEAPEIGRVTIQNITRFVPNTKLSGGNAIVFGFGDIGAQVGYQLNKALNMAISVVDTVAAKVMEAKHKRDFVAEAESRFSDLRFRDRAVLVVGTTGRREGSITRQILRKLPNGCIIVSTSSDRAEIDVNALENMAVDIREIEEGKTVYRVRTGSRRISLTLLAEGYPINFYGSESLPNASIDPIMTLLILCAAELCNGSIRGRKIHEDAVNKIVENNKLIENFLSRSRYQDL